MSPFDRLEAFFRDTAPLVAGDRIVAGFSGGPDSTALLAGLARLARGGSVGVVAVHLDHGLDPDSAARAAAAARLAGRLGVPCVVERWAIDRFRRPGESREVAGRRMRYGRLGALARQAGARYVATAHHRDDQAETVLLRLLFGSGLAGLAGIRPTAPLGGATLVRPLLAVPKSALVAAVAALGLTPVEDPGNEDLAIPRNLLRHRLLPHLAATDPELPVRLAGLAERAAGAQRRVEATALARLEAGREGGRVSVARDAFAALPRPLQPFALAALHRAAGAPYPASAAARSELLRQLTQAGRARIGCDCGAGWRWEARPGRDGRLTLVPPDSGPQRAVQLGFTYT
jgi:tRNA(Ile)-lysidine synthase